MGRSLYLKKPGHPELGWLVRCACCRELVPASGDAHPALSLACDLHALFCSSERCEASVRLELRTRFGELEAPSAPGALPQCALCGVYGQCVSLRFNGKTVAWICTGKCLEVARERIEAAWPDALPYIDEATGFETERPALDRKLPQRPGTRPPWVRGLIWLPEPARADAHRVGWHVPMLFRPFSLFLWSGPELVVRQLRMNGRDQLITHDNAGVPAHAFRGPLPFERFAKLVTPGSEPGDLPTISQDDWDRLLLEGETFWSLELETIEIGGRLELDLSGPYQHGCIIGRTLAPTRATGAEVAALERLAAQTIPVDVGPLTIGGPEAFEEITEDLGGGLDELIGATPPPIGRAPCHGE